MTIKDDYLKMSICLILLTLGISLAPVAAAVPATPSMAFEGNVTLGVTPAPVNTNISVYLGGAFLKNVSVITAGQYDFTIHTATEEDNGKTITFKVGDQTSINTSTYEYKDYVDGYTKLDLYFVAEGEDYVAPSLSNSTASPAIILNGTDSSTISVTATDDASGIHNVTLDLSPIGGAVVSMDAGEDNVYTYDVSSTEAGNFTFNITAVDNSSNQAEPVTVSLTVYTEADVVSELGGGDGFNSSEIISVVNPTTISTAVKYVALKEYFSGGWDLL